MAQFMLLLHEDPSSFADVSAEDIQRITGEYMDWRQSLIDSGHLVGGEKLTDDGGRQLSLDGAELRVIDGPFSEAKEVVAGYFMISAEDYDEAVELSKSCPHLTYGLRIDVRQVDETHA